MTVTRRDPLIDRVEAIAGDLSNEPGPDTLAAGLDAIFDLTAALRADSAALREALVALQALASLEALTQQTLTRSSSPAELLVELNERAGFAGQALTAARKLRDTCPRESPS